MLFLLSYKVYSQTFIATSTNEHQHIFKLKVELLDDNKISVSNYVCFKCLNKKKNSDLKKGFVKTICGVTEYDGINFSAYCNSSIIGNNTMFGKQIKGTLIEAFMSGQTRHETLPRLAFGQAKFTFLKPMYYKDYIEHIKHNTFLTTAKYNEMIKLKRTKLLEEKLANNSNINQKDNKGIQELENELAVLKKTIEKNKKLIIEDTIAPEIVIIKSIVKDKQAIVEGSVSDNINVAELTINGKSIAFDKNGVFKYETFVPNTGKKITLLVTDNKGLSNQKTLTLKREESSTRKTFTFQKLNPKKFKNKDNEHSLALIIGVQDYLYSPKASYADLDASYFSEFAYNILGIKKNNIKTLRNSEASNTEILIAIKKWLKTFSIANKSNIYLFFAGHGLASTDGEELYLLPYDGDPQLLKDTALLKSKLLKSINSFKPNSLTAFFDTCYSGQTREKELILTDTRPIAIVPVESEVPKNFTIFSASSGSEISGILPEADHGLFSYFLMKGLEGDADKNNDKKITNGELHSYVRYNVTRQAVRLGREQTPELKGDLDRVLVEFN